MPRQTTIRGPLRRLVDALGGVIAAAEALGVTRRTLLRWGRGETRPGEEDRKRVVQVARQMGIRVTFRRAS